jgi:hypothetical protein
MSGFFVLKTASLIPVSALIVRTAFHVAPPSVVL